MDYFDLKVAEEVFCECCTRPAQDIHHIHGRGSGKDVIENLMAVCRKCHDRATLNQVSKDEMQFIHNCFLMGQRKQFFT